MVIPSLSGTTKESVKALSYCQDRGAKVVTLTGHADTPLADLADDNFLNFAEDDTSCESFYLQSLLVALSVLHHRGAVSYTHLDVYKRQPEGRSTGPRPDPPQESRDKVPSGLDSPPRRLRTLSLSK